MILYSHFHFNRKEYEKIMFIHSLKKIDSSSFLKIFPAKPSIEGAILQVNDCEPKSNQ